ncbi:MAG: D-alanine-D-alanine ligase [Candidatus Magasanikbacteria bacterium GW2011_GWA2_37_8]|uniref:D-alanine-D-alanine ligase n=1 Tax=Candidatus Magasanikbacteria bacterium GW2011_GWA2_37_8 TaxID=1619036 RepID=A0A0G0HG68_9BACT|nr:MAG: D-alanine-D-alanine ligase [Candidatus Magasanikbacteria bacterium GW2011_GWA2_37_8]
MIKNKKIKVAVLMGGPSSEREVSLITGKAVFDNLDRKKYQVSLIEMDKQSKFWLKEKEGRRLVDFVNKDRNKFDVVFIALHGAPGEDGSIQGMFDTLGIKYTGCGVLSSALSMNKVYAGQIYFINGLQLNQ